MSIILSNKELIFVVSSYLSGNFGVVHKGVLKTDGNVVDVAVKTIKSKMFVCIFLLWLWIWIDIPWLYLWYKRHAQLKCLAWSALNIAADKNWRLTSCKSISHPRATITRCRSALRIWFCCLHQSEETETRSVKIVFNHHLWIVFCKTTKILYPCRDEIASCCNSSVILVRCCYFPRWFAKFRCQLFMIRDGNVVWLWL